MNARVSTPDRPVSSKSCCPGKAELGVQFIARDPDHLVRSVQWGHPALWRESAGQRGPKLALVVVLRRGQHGRPGRAHLMLEGGIYVYYEDVRPRATGPNRCQGTSIKVRVSSFIKSGRCNQKGDLV